MNWIVIVLLFSTSLYGQTSLTATATGPTTVQLNWTVIPGQTYTLSQGTNVLISGSTASSFTWTGANPSTTYTFSLGTTVPPVVSSATTPAMPPPTSAKVIDGVTATYVDPAGVMWIPDAKICGGAGTYANNHAITGGNVAQFLYQHESYGKTLTCTLPAVAPGNYALTFHWAEIYWGTGLNNANTGSCTGRRIFSVAVNGQLAVTNMDICAAGGGSPYAAVDDTVNMTSTGMPIQIVATASVDNAKFDAISITPIITGHSVSLTWAPSPLPPGDPPGTTISGYNVYRGSTAAGPFSIITMTPATGTTYTDLAVSAGQTAYYVVTALATCPTTPICSGTVESTYSNVATATVPSP